MRTGWAEALSRRNLRLYSRQLYAPPVNFNYLQDYYRRNKDAHYVDKRQACADNAVAEEFDRQIICIDVLVRAIKVRVRFALDVGHFYGSVNEPYTAKSPK